MQKYEAIENGIANGDVKALREALGSICYTSRDFSSGEFDEAIEYVKFKGIDIMDSSLVGSPTISSQKSSFTDDDFAKAIFELKKNFCEERIEDVRAIGKALYSSKVVENIAKPIPEVNKETSRDVQSPNASSHQRSKFLLALGLVAVLAIIVILLLLAIL